MTMTPIVPVLNLFNRSIASEVHTWLQQQGMKNKVGTEATAMVVIMKH